jgi:hypothetical protein
MDANTSKKEFLCGLPKMTNGTGYRTQKNKGLVQQSLAGYEKEWSGQGARRSGNVYALRFLHVRMYEVRDDSHSYRQGI